MKPWGEAMQPTIKYFIFLPKKDALIEVNSPEISVKELNKRVYKRKALKAKKLRSKIRKLPNNLAYNMCRECGKEIEANDIVVLDHVYLLSHKECFREPRSMRDIDTYIEIAKRFGIFMED